MNILKYAINADQGTLHGQPLHVGVQNSLGHMWVALGLCSPRPQFRAP